MSIPYLIKLADITSDEFAEAVLVEEGETGIKLEYFRQLEKQNIIVS